MASIAAAVLSVAFAACGDDEHETIECLASRPVAEGFETVSVTFDIDELEDALADEPAIAARLGFTEITTCLQADAAWREFHPGERPPLTDP